MAATLVLGLATVGLVILAVVLESRSSKLRKAANLHLRERDDAREAQIDAARRADIAEKKLVGLTRERDDLAKTVEELKPAAQRAAQEVKRLERDLRRVRDDSADAISGAEARDVELKELRREVSGQSEEKRRLTDQLAAAVAALKDAEQRREADRKQAAERPVERPAERPVERVERAPRPEVDAVRQNELENEITVLRGKFGDLKRRTAQREAETRRYRGAYESHLRAYRLLKAEVDLLEAEVTYLRYGEDGYPEAPVRVDDELDDVSSPATHGDELMAAVSTDAAPEVADVVAVEPAPTPEPEPEPIVAVEPEPIVAAVPEPQPEAPAVELTPDPVPEAPVA